MMGRDKKLINLKMKLPNWIINNTFEQLKEKERLEKELNASLQENIKILPREYRSSVGEANKERQVFNKEKEESPYGKILPHVRSSAGFPMIDASFNEEIHLKFDSFEELLEKLSRI